MTAPARRALAAVLLAETISTAGTRMSQLALPWLVLTTTGDPVTTGLVGTAAIVPFVVLQVISAPLVDRWGGRRVTVTSNLTAGVVTLAVPLLWHTGRLGLIPLLGLVFLAGAARGPAETATRVLLPAATDAAGTSIDRATALFDGASRTAMLLGAPLAAALIPVIGAADVVTVDAASFLLAAALLAAFAPATSTRRAERYLPALRDGLRYVLHHPLLRAVSGMILITNLCDSAMSGLLLILWAHDHFGGTGRLGLITGVGFGCAAVGAFAVAGYGTRLPRRWTYAIAFLLAGAPRWVVLALPVGLGVVLPVWAVSGLASGAINPLLGAALYDRVPRHLQARVLSAATGIAWAAMPFGALLAGATVTATSLTTTLLIGTVLYGLITLDPLVRRVWAGMDRRPAVSRSGSPQLR